MVRNKPRLRNQWWNTDIKDDLQDAHALVTNMSLSLIDAILNMVCHIYSCSKCLSQVTSRDISKIEKPFKPNKMTMRDWMKFVAEHQFTLNEIGSELHMKLLKDNMKIRYYKDINGAR